VILVRLVLPLALTVVGIVFLAMGGENNGGVGVMLCGIALVIWIFVGMIALSARSTGDREAEQAARDEFARTGRWPYDPETDD
jgi:ABC-type spermidine/putrescine transport system permease subunit II